MFYKDQRVICVNASFPPVVREQWDRYPRQNEILTVSMIADYTGIRFANETKYQLQFIEIGGRAPWFAACRFRPLVERKTDISIFKKMLVPKKATEDA